jgi:hypothetical protein
VGWKGKELSRQEGSEVEPHAQALFDLFRVVPGAGSSAGPGALGGS